MTASKGRVHDVFTQLLQVAATTAASQASAERAGTGRLWAKAASGTASPLDVPGTTAGFNRDQINANYEEVVADGANPGTTGDAISLTVQVDVVAVHERGYRARHCTPVRLAALAASRRAGHGHPAGLYTGGIARYAHDTLAAGAFQ